MVEKLVLIILMVMDETGQLKNEQCQSDHRNQAERMLDNWFYQAGLMDSHKPFRKKYNCTHPRDGPPACQ